jgi:hypothetical protein
MFTPDSLLEMAVDFETKGNEQAALGNQSDPATRERSDFFGKAYEFRRKSMEATVCAEWMENHDITEAATIGPFGNITVERGKKIRIKAGAVVFGFGTEIPNGGKIVTRKYIVAIHRADNGFAIDANGGHRGKAEVRNQQVHWAGTGGYWRWTDASNVEILS